MLLNKINGEGVPD